MSYAKSAYILLYLSVVLNCVVFGSETKSPEKDLRPRNYNPHPYEKSKEDMEPGESTSRYIQKIAARNNQMFGRKGPVIFPNTDLPPPRNPLIVTSRPLLEDIAKSDLLITPKPPTAVESIQRIAAEDYRNALIDNANKYYQSPSYAYQNNVRQQTYRGYLKQIFGERTNPVSKYLSVNQIPNPTASNVLKYQDGAIVTDVSQSNPGHVVYPYLRNYTVLGRHPYPIVAKQQLLDDEAGSEYDSAVQGHAVVTPVYNHLENYDDSKVYKSIRKPKLNPSWREHETNTVENLPENEDDGDYYNDNIDNEDKQYAFSYSVKDHETGDDFSHTQQHVGSATKGEYRVKLPDGRMQIVSYTADNGGYKADVRYEEEPDANAHKNEEIEERNYHQPVHQNIVKDYRRKYLPNKTVTLGRIVVPSQEEVDYQDVDYNSNYNEVSSTKAPYLYRQYVEDPVKEVLITSKPGYLYTPAPTQENFIYNQYNHEGYIPNVTPSQKSYLYASPSTYSPMAQSSNQYNVYSTTTNDPQEASKTYSHFYNAESVKFVSTTPKYRNYKPTFYKTTTKTPTTRNDDVVNNGNNLSTPEPEALKYDQVDSPAVVKIEPRPKNTVNYTTLAPLLFNSLIVNNGVTSTTPRPIETVSSTLKSPINPKDSVQGAGNFGSVDIRKYFTFTKR